MRACAALVARAAARRTASAHPGLSARQAPAARPRRACGAWGQRRARMAASGTEGGRARAEGLLLRREGEHLGSAEDAHAVRSALC